MSDYVKALRAKVGSDLILMPSVGAFIRGDDERILLVKHVEGRWQLPGGAVDPGERPDDACRRECHEEASVDIELLRILGVFGGPEYQTTYSTGDVVAFVVSIYEARIVGGEPAAGDDETQDVGWFDVAQLASLDMHVATRTTLAAVLD